MDSRAPERFAAIVAPAVDRVHAGVHQRSRARGADLARRHGVQHPGLLITLRFVLLRGALARAAFPLAVRYVPVESVLHAVDDLVATGRLGPVHDADAPRTDSAGTVRDVYRRLGLPFNSAAERAVTEFLAARPRDMHGGHRYSFDDLGMSLADVRADFVDYQRYFAVPDEVSHAGV